MSFDLAQTPTLQAVANPDEQLLAQDLQKRFDESVSQANARPEVVEAVEVQRIASENLDRLKKAERVLSECARETRGQIAAGTQAALDAAVGSAASAGKPDFRKLKELGVLENQYRHASRAIERVVEDLIPLANIASLREESHALMTKARAVEGIAQERAEKLLSHLRDAVIEEVVLPVDLSKGVAGALLAHAAGLKRRAVQLSESADHMERLYHDQHEWGRNETR